MATVNTIATTLPAAPQQNSFLSDEAKRRLLAAQLLQRQGADASAPVYTTGHGLAKLGAGLAGGLMEGLTEAREAELNKENAALIGQFLMAGQGGAPATASPSITSEPLSPAVTSPPASSRVYSENEFNPLDAAVATPKELAVGVPAPAQYAPTIGKAAVDNDIPPQLLAAQIKQESGFNPNAVSPAGAQGISQFMPGTAAEMGINPLDPNQAIPAGARYLRQQIDKFGGSIPHGLAAYNGGPGRLQRAGGDISRMPAETRQYVQSVQRMAGTEDPAALPPGATPTEGFAVPGQPSPQALAAGLQSPAAAGPDRMALAAKLLADPRTPPQMRAMIAQQMTPDNQLMQMPDGTVVSIDKRTNKATPVYQGAVKPIEVNGRLVNPQSGQVVADFSNPQTATIGNELVDTRTGRVIHQGNKTPTYGVIAEDKFGNKQYGWINPANQTTSPGSGQGGQPAAAATVTGPDGSQIPIPDGVNPRKFRDDVTSATADAVTGKKTEVQAKSEKFGNKMELAERNLPKDIGGWENYVGGWMDVGGSTTNFAKTENYQKYSQAKNSFITALLRDESGAAIGSEEFKRYEKELFPQPGDPPSLLKQKSEARKVAIDGMKKAAGPGYKSPVDLQGPVKVASPDEARKLPKGTKIVLPDGSEGVVP